MKTKLDKTARSGERRPRGNTVAGQASAQRRSVGTTGSTAVAFCDNRRVAVAQRKLRQAVDGSPRQLAQAEQLSGAFGLPLQRVEDEEELQMMAGPGAVQREVVEEEEPLQGTFDPVQRQGRVQPTMQMAGEQVNDDSGLEQEADVMGAKAMQLRAVRPESVVPCPQ